MGHRVTGVDADEAKVRALRSGACPIHEPGLEELLQRHLGRRLEFTSSSHEAVPGAELVFLAVGTHQAADGAQAALIAADRQEFKELDLGRLRAIMARPLVIDGCNLFAPQDAARAGLEYHSIGRRSIAPAGVHGRAHRPAPAFEEGRRAEPRVLPRAGGKLLPYELAPREV
jgi:UDP-N-acetyl-D-mannosaminuronate dehydrogenase